MREGQGSSGGRNGQQSLGQSVLVACALHEEAPEVVEGNIPLSLSHRRTLSAQPKDSGDSLRYGQVLLGHSRLYEGVFHGEAEARTVGPHACFGGP